MGNRRALLRFCAAGLCYLVVVASIPTIVEMGNAFIDRPAEAPPASMRGRGVLRVRNVAMKPGLFDDTGAHHFIDRKKVKTDGVVRIRMNLFPDVKVDVDWSQVDKLQNPAGFAWTGKVVGPSADSATLLVSGTSVTGNIPGTAGKMYQIRTTSDGVIWIREIDSKTLPNESAPKHPALNES